MGFFNLFKNELAIDLGTANVLIIYNNEIVVDQPAIVAIDNTTKKVVAVGQKARQMEGKTHENIRIIRPLTDGIIADFNAAEHMIRGMIQMIKKGKGWGLYPMRMVISIPAGITEVEKRAIRDSAETAGAKELFLIYEPMAAAIGIGIDVEAPNGNMVVDIGGGTSEIAVIAMSGIVCDQSVKIAGRTFDADIIQYMRQQHNLLIGLPTAEKMKIEIGSALTELKNPPKDFAVQGRDLMSGIPKKISISYTEIAQCLDKSISKIEEAIMKALEITPPEISGDIYDNGIYLTGGGAMLRGLDKRIATKTKLPIHIAEDPLRAVAIGTNIALKKVGQATYLMQ